VREVENRVALLVGDVGKFAVRTRIDSGYRRGDVRSLRRSHGSGEEFELLLTDLMMPEMDGIALLDAARALEQDLVGIVMTGHGAIDTAIAAMKAGALDYILKPFKLRTVLPVIERALAVRNLQVANAELQRRVRERTEELEVANKELEAFSYSVSHDLRAPLRAVTGFSTILMEDHASELSEGARKHLNTVASSAKRMEQLIEDLLAFSRLALSSF